MVGETFKKAREGDLKSIEEICSTTWEPLYRFIYYKVQNQQEAEDITQETYVRALSHLRQNRVTPDKYVGFLKTVAMNVLRDRWRKNKRQGIRVDLEILGPAETALKDPTEDSAQRAWIANALEQLNPEQRTVVELRILKGYSVAETARLMDKNQVNVRVLQYRALHTLAGILKRHEP